VWFDLEATWHDPRPRHELLPELGQAGVATAALVADVFPELHPEWFEPNTTRRFSAHLTAHLEAGSHLVCISEATRADVLALAAARGFRPATSVVTLGADFRHGSVGSLPPGLGGRRTLLAVSTLEPRKNQALLLDVYDRLRRERTDLALVLVGKQGWHVDELVERIRRHPENGRGLRWLPGADDATLMALYRHATLSLVPSFAEGFGAPVVESLAQGVPTIASSGGALAEVGGDDVEYADPHDAGAWAQLVERHLDDAAHHQAARARLADYRAPTWKASASQVLAALAPLSPH
jgi:glycosyltransferase involved in cell wall biosynthesis